MTTDFENLREYCRCGSEQAFRSLVESHAALVHGVAVRMTRDQALAEEITQSVFIILARKAPSIPAEQLPGWLHKVAAGESRNAVRKEARRHALNLQYAQSMKDADSLAREWEVSIAPHLDDAVAKLSREDRQMMLLRYFEQRDFEEIARLTGLSREACKKRAQRALARLTELLGPVRGQAGAGATPALAGALGSFALLPPSASAASLSSVALASTGSLASGAPSLFKLIQYMTTKQVATAAAVPAVKLLTVLPPILALSAGAIWTVSQSRAIASLESRTVLYRQSLDAASQADKGSGAEVPKSTVALLANGRIDWGKFSGNTKTMSFLVAMKRRLRGMSPAELIAEFDDIGKLDVDDKEALQEVVLDSLAYKDPKAVIERTPGTRSGNLFWIAQEHAFGKWGQSSPDEAVKWLDRKIAAGDFKTTLLNRNPMLNFYETSMIYNLLPTDLKAAAGRLQGMPEEQQTETLRGVLDRATPEQGQAMADLIQAAFPEDQWENKMSQAGSAKREIIRQAMEKAAAQRAK